MGYDHISSLMSSDPKFGMVLSNHKYVYICVSSSFEIVKLLSGLGKSWMLYHVI